MRFVTITAKYSGTCRRCQGPIRVGQSIRFAGRGLTYHLKADCLGAETSAVASPHLAKREPRQEQPRTCAQGGRCEDYPCCGCDGLHGQDRYYQPDHYEGY